MPHPVTSFGNALVVNFISNNNITARGFHATYAASSSCKSIWQILLVYISDFFKRKTTSWISLAPWHSLCCNPLLPFLLLDEVLGRISTNQRTARQDTMRSWLANALAPSRYLYTVIILKPLLSPYSCSLRRYFPHGQRSFQQPWLSRAVSTQHRVCLDNSQLPWQPAAAVLHVNALPGVITQPL